MRAPGRTRAELNRLVADSRTFILRCASRTCGRYVTDSDEAYETAMLAFWGLSTATRSGSGSFQAFAAMVIRRRLLDAFDRTSRLSREIAAGHAMTWDEGEEEAGGIVSEVQRAIVQDAADETARVREEIEALGEVLGDYGFSFFDLAEASPKAGKTRQCCAKAVRWMLAAAERVMNMRGPQPAGGHDFPCPVHRQEDHRAPPPLYHCGHGDPRRGLPLPGGIP